MSIKGMSALLLDDDAGLRGLVSRVLENAGMQIFEADNAASALELIRQKRPHIVIADLNLRGKQSGYEFIANVASDPDLLDIPILVLSGSRDNASLRRALGAGAADFLTKPFDAGLLLQKTRKHLHDSDFIEVELEGSWLITMQIPCSLAAANQEGVILECSARLSPEQKVRFASEVCEALGIRRAFPMAVLGSVPCDPIGFRNELRFRGLTREQLAALEEVIARWHTQPEFS